MPWVELNGEKKKVACGPCIRGHRSSKCDHNDRVLLEVRKPGRPLSSCPHPPGSCSCERVVINYTIPKTRDCKCSAGNTPVGSASNTNGPAINGSNRVQKTRQKRASTSINPVNLARGLQDQVVLPENGLPNGESTASSETGSTTFSSERGNDDASSPSSFSPSIDIDPRQLDVKMEFNGSDETSAPQNSCCGPEIETDSDTALRSIGDNAATKASSTAKSCCGGARAEAETQVSPVQNSCCSGSKTSRPSTSNGATQPVPHVINTIYPPKSPFVHQPNVVHTAIPPAHSPYVGYPHSNGPPTIPFGFQPQYIAQQSPFRPVPHPGNGEASSIEHNCNCGDSCACLGCASHPQNSATMEYIRYFSQYLLGAHGMVRPPPYHIANHYIPPVPTGHFSYQPHPNIPNGNGMPQVYMPPHSNSHSHAGAVYAQHTGIPHTWQMNSSHSSIQATPTTEYDQFNFATPSLSSNINPRSTPGTETRSSATPTRTDSGQNQSAQDFVDDDKSQEASPAADHNTPILSPSSFFLQSLELPGCDDPTGTCQCGDGCECVGCLTHGGHNGVPLEPNPEEQSALDFGFDAEYTIDDAFVDAPS